MFISNLFQLAVYVTTSRDAWKELKHKGLIYRNDTFDPQVSFTRYFELVVS